MKYKYVRKTFKCNTIEIPDNAIAIKNNGYVSLETKQVKTIDWIRVRKYALVGTPITKTETIWGIAFEWLEPIKE